MKWLVFFILLIVGVNAAIKFEGSSSKLTVDSTQAGQANWSPNMYKFTISFWVKSNSDTGTLLSKLDQSNDVETYGYTIRYDDGPDGRKMITFKLHYGDNSMKIAVPMSTDTKEWCFIAVTRISLNMISATGVKGVTVYSDTLTSTSFGYMLTPEANLILGNNNDGNDPFDGMMEDLYLYGTPLFGDVVLNNLMLNMPLSSLNVLDRFPLFGDANSITGDIGVLGPDTYISSAALSKFTLTTASAGKALMFDGHADRLVCATGVLDGLDAFTVEALVKPSVLPGGPSAQYIMSYKTEALVFNVHMTSEKCESDGSDCRNLRLLASVISSKGQKRDCQIDQIGYINAANQWHHIAVTVTNAYSASSSDDILIVVYVDGKTPTQTLGDSAMDGAERPVFTIGALSAYEKIVEKQLLAGLDEIRIWNVARSPTQIQSAIDVLTPHDAPGLVALYTMDDLDATSTAVTDVTSNRRHCLFGMPSDVTILKPSVFTSDLVMFKSRASDADVGTMTPNRVAHRALTLFTVPFMRVHPDSTLTRFAFAKQGQCMSERINDNQVVGSYSPISFTLTFPDGGFFVGCYSGDGGLTYIEQRHVNVTVYEADASKSYIDTLSTYYIEIYVPSPITLTGNGIVELPTTKIAFSPVGASCSTKRYGTTVITGSSFTLSSIGKLSTFKTCYTLNDIDWYQQSPSIEVIQPRAKIDLKNMQPTKIGAGAKQWLTLPNFRVTPTSIITDKDKSALYPVYPNKTIDVDLPNSRVWQFCIRYGSNCWPYSFKMITLVTFYIWTWPTISPNTFAANTITNMTVTSSISPCDTCMFGLRRSGTVHATALYTNGLTTLSNAISSAGQYEFVWSSDSMRTLVYPYETVTVVDATTTTISGISPTQTWTGYTPDVTFNGILISSTTKIAFAAAGQCGTVRLAETPVATVNHVKLSSGIDVSGNYKLCLSTDGTTYHEQAGIVMAVNKAATVTDITAFSVTSAAAGTTIACTITGGVGGAKIALAPPHTCSIDTLRSSQVTLPASQMTMPTSHGTYALCYSVDGSTWLQQTEIAAVIIHGASSQSISAINGQQSPQFFLNAVRTATFTGAFPSPSTMGFFVTTLSCNGDRISPFNLATDNTINVAGFNATGIYYICYSIDGGTTTYLQTKVSVVVSDNVFLAKVLTARFGANLNKKVGVATQPSMTVTLHTDPVTEFPFGIGFTQDSRQCVSMSAITPYSTLAAVQLGNNNLGWGSNAGFSTSGTYYACYEDSTTGHNPDPSSPASGYVGQINLNSVAVVEATSTSITLLSKAVIGAGTTPSIRFHGAQATPNTAIAFSLDGCVTRVGETTMTNDAQEETMIPIGVAINTVGGYDVCYNVGNGWMRQSMVNLTVINAVSNSITSLSPPSLATYSTHPLSFTGAVASSQTVIGFALTGQCSTPYTKAHMSTNGPVTFTASINVTGTYAVCYSTDDGSSFVEQSVNLVIVEATTTTITSLSIAEAGAFSKPNITFVGAPITPSTKVAFATNGQCVSGPRYSETSLSSDNRVQLSTPLPGNATVEHVTYALCLSTSPWLEQNGVTLNVFNPQTTTITAITPGTIGTGSTPFMTFNDAPLLPSTRVAFSASASGQCDTDRVGSTVVTMTTVRLGVAIGQPNTYTACLSVDDGVIWTAQQVGITVTDASSGSITQVIPSVIAVNAINNVTFDGAVGTALTRVALSNDSCVSRVGVTSIVNTTSVLMSTVPMTGTYAVCYTVNDVDWVKQGVSVTVIEATATSVTEIKPSVISVDSNPTMTLKHNGEAILTTPTTWFAFAPHDHCSVANKRIGTTWYPSSPAVLGSAITNTGFAQLCFTVDSINWYEQAVVLNITIAASTSITSYAPSVIGVGIRPTLSVYGADGSYYMGTSSTWIAFAPTGQCGNPGMRQGVTQLSGCGPTQLATAFTGDTRTLSLCLTISTVWHEQVLAPNLTIIVARNDSITTISPASIEKESKGPITLMGIVPSVGTRIAFAYPGQCDVGRFATTQVTSSGPITLYSGIAVATTYSLCYSIDNGDTFVEQMIPKLVVSDCVGIRTCASCTMLGHCRWCIDSNTCGLNACNGTVANSTSICPKLTRIDTGKSGSVLGNTMIDVTGSLFVDTSLTSRLTYRCGFGGTDNMIFTNATRVDITTLQCTSPSWSDDDTVALSVWLGSSRYVSNTLTHSYYDCSIGTALGCGGCYIPTKTQCGWCMEPATCGIASQCTPMGHLFGGQACPVITSLDPYQYSYGGGGTVTVHGSLFIDSPDLKCVFGNQVIATKFISINKVTCAVPAVPSVSAVDVGLEYKGKPYTKNKRTFFFIKDDVVAPVAASAAAVMAVMGAAAFVFYRRYKKQQTFAPPSLTRAVLDDILFKPPKLAQGSLALSSKLSELEELLCRDDAAQLRFAIASCTQATEMDMAARSFTHMLYPRGRVLDVIKEYITDEVQRATSQATLFRTNSFATKLFNVYSKMLGIPLLHKALGYVLNEAISTSGNVEMDSTRREDGESDDPMARFQLLLVNQKVLKSIIKAEIYVPSEFRELFKHLQSVIREKFPIRPSELASIIYSRLVDDLGKTREAFSVSKEDHDALVDMQSQLSQSLNALKGCLDPMIKQFTKLGGHVRDMSAQLDTIINSAGDLQGSLDVTSHAARRLIAEAQERQNSIAIGGFFFLRFLVPAVTTPESYGILREPPNPEQRRLLVLVAKVLQNLSNNVEFGRKEEFMTKLNDFLRSNHGEVNKLFDKLASSEREGKIASGPKVKVPSLQRDAAIVSLYQHIQSNLEKIITHLEEKNCINLSLELSNLMENMADEAAKFDVGRPLKKGWLTKQGGRIKTWKERFFVLKLHVLQYYKSDKDTQPVGVIMLSHITDIHTTTDVRDEDEYTFAVVTEHRTYNISAETEADRKGWIDAIQGRLVAMKEKSVRALHRASSRPSTPSMIDVPIDSDSDDEPVSPRAVQLRPLTARGPARRPLPPTPRPIPTPTPAPTPISAPISTPTPTPIVWYEVFDKKSSRVYYVHSVTKQAIWQHPGPGVEIRKR